MDKTTNKGIPGNLSQNEAQTRRADDFDAVDSRQAKSRDQAHEPRESGEGQTGRSGEGNFSASSNVRDQRRDTAYFDSQHNADNNEGLGSKDPTDSLDDKR